MDVRIHAAGGQYTALTGDGLGAGSDDDIHSSLRIGIARFADPRNPAILDTHVRLDDAPVIEDQGISDDRVGYMLRGSLALPHAVADHLPAAEFNFVTVTREVPLHFDDKLRVTQTHPIARGGSKHVGIRATGYPAHDASVSMLPMTLPWNP